MASCSASAFSAAASDASSVASSPSSTWRRASSRLRWSLGLTRGKAADEPVAGAAGAAAGRRVGAGIEDTGWSLCRRTQPRPSERSLV